MIVVFTSTLSTTSSPVTIISYDLATRLTSQLSQRRPDAIIVVSDIITTVNHLQTPNNHHLIFNYVILNDVM